MTHRETDAVHGGSRRDPVHGAVAEPLVLSSTFDYPERADGAAAPYIYTRYANPTIETAERRLAVLEGTPDAVLFSSGMGAISSALLTVLKTGDGLLATPDLYGGTDLLLQRGMSRVGVAARTLPREAVTDPDRLRRLCTPSDKVLYIESPTNPMLRVLDVPALVSAAHASGLMTIVDNTFAGPCLARPTKWGADLVCESATKTLGGHSDLIAGVVAGQPPLMAAVRETRRVWGTSLDPGAAHRLLRGLPTLPLRLRQAGESALRLADALAAADWVAAVHHPAQPEHPDHDVARRTLDGPLPLVTIVLKGGEAAAKRLRRGVRLARPAASLGGVETLLSLPSETSHVHLDAGTRTGLGIPPGTVRIAVGLEHPEDLLDDLEQAIRDPERPTAHPPKTEPL